MMSLYIVHLHSETLVTIMTSYLHMPHYVEIWHHLQNRKYIRCCTVIRTGPRYIHR